MMKDDDFKLLRGFADRLTDRQTDICDCRVAFATENASVACCYSQLLRPFLKHPIIFKLMVLVVSSWI